MNQIRNAQGCWWILLILAIIGAVIFGLIVAVPYGNQKSVVDSLARDGDVESYTQQLLGALRIIFLPFLILSVSLFAYLLVQRAQSLTKMQAFLSWLQRFLKNRSHEIKAIFKALKPAKDEFFPIIILLLVVLLGAFFRYAYMWRPMGHDEAYTFMAFASRGLGVVITDYHLPNNHIFHTILVYLFYQLFGDSPAVIRFAAFIAGILIVPATYLIGKIFYDWKIGLVAASIIAAIPVMVDYSTVARGYTLITLFALILVGLAAYVKDHQNLTAWFMLVAFSCVGLYTNPTMIYPIGMTFTWLLLSGLIKDIDTIYGKNYYLHLAISAIAIIILTGFLYLPIVYSSGLQSVVGNDVIETLSWSDFTQSLLPRINNTWREWNRALHPMISWIAIIGLFASFFFPRLPRNRRVPLIAAGFLWIATALLVQRVAPWPRIWLFLLPFFVIWITAGIFGLITLIANKFQKSGHLMTIFTGVGVMLVLLAGLIRTYPQYSEKIYSKGEVEQVSDFLLDYLQEGDVVVVTSPDTVVLKYYLMRNKIDSDFTELIKGKEFKRSIVVVNQAHGQTLDYVLDRRSFLDDVRVESAEEIYQSRRFILYQVFNN
jgi:hypothetical protein